MAGGHHAGLKDEADLLIARAKKCSYTEPG